MPGGVGRAAAFCRRRDPKPHPPGLPSKKPRLSGAWEGGGRLHALSQGGAEGGTGDFLGPFHEPGEVVGHHLVPDGGLHGLDNLVRRFLPTQMAQHHFRREDQGARIHLVQPGVLGGRAVGGFKHRVMVGNIGPRGDADAPHLGRQGVGNVIPIQV